LVDLESLTTGFMKLDIPWLRPRVITAQFVITIYA